MPAVFTVKSHLEECNFVHVNKLHQAKAPHNNEPAKKKQKERIQTMMFL